MRILLLLVALLPLPLFAKPADWAKAIDAIAAADAVTPPCSEAALFVGSSSIGRWSTLAHDFAGIPVINRGFGGSELADSVYYADRIVIPYRPRVVVLYAGDNDLANGNFPETVHADFRTFCLKIHEALPKTSIVYLAIKPSPARWKLRAKVEQTNELIRGECGRDPRRIFVDLYSPMLDPQGQPRPELFQPDKLHLSQAGYALWTAMVAEELAKIFPRQIRQPQT